VRRGILVFEDYAHHPTEIVSTLEAVRWTEPKRVIVIFQPHLYSRTKFFSTEFAQALAQSDHAIVVDIYGAREEPQPGVDAGLIVDAAHALGVRHVELVRDMYAVPAYLAPRLEEGDVVLILGAGNITRITPLLLEACGK
jgi:UDP-N-acetylmuramate--alanine ligase